MNKLFKLIYINLLGTFNINQILIAREEGVKSNLETKSIMTGLILLFYGYIIYLMFSKIPFTNYYNILGISFFASTIACFIIDIMNIEPLIFKSDDTEILFAMPITREQILFSKLFTIYIKNIIAVVIFMIPSIISFITHAGSISDVFGLMYILYCIIIPFIPIVISSIIIYIDNYFKTKYYNNFTYKIIKSTIIATLCLILIIAIINLDFTSLEPAISKITNLYFFTYLFTYSLENTNIIVFATGIVIPILILYIYYAIISSNYERICSMLKGIKKKSAFHYKKCHNLKKTLGICRKELATIFQNKVYLTSSYSSIVGFTFVLFFLLKAIDFQIFSDIPFFDLYFNTYFPPILATLVTFSTSAISSISLEKDNLKMLGTMPIKLETIILGKSLANILVASAFIIINAIISLIFLDLKKIEIIFCFLFPFISLIFVTSTSILLDIRFIEKTTTDDNTIIKQRLINLIPMCLSLAISTIPILFPLIEQYYFTLGSYLMAMLFIMLIEYIYFKMNRQKLIRNLLK